MYDLPIVRDNIKIFRMHPIFRRQMIQAFFGALIVGSIALYALSLNVPSQSDMVFYTASFGVLLLYLLWGVYQRFIFRLELTAQGGKVVGLGKTIQFEWSAVKKLGYVDWFDENLNLNELCLILEESTVTKGFWLPSKYLFPFIVLDTRIPVSILYHRKSFWSLSTKPEQPTYEEYQAHLYRFLQSDIGKEVIQYAPQTLDDVVQKYLPDMSRA